jgi:hypothetical protein
VVRRKPLAGLPLFQVELLQYFLSQAFPDFMARVPGQGGLIAVQVDFRVIRTFFENRPLLG